MKPIDMREKIFIDKYRLDCLCSVFLDKQDSKSSDVKTNHYLRRYVISNELSSLDVREQMTSSMFIRSR
jgi:hypothetical protein